MPRSRNASNRSQQMRDRSISQRCLETGRLRAKRRARNRRSIVLYDEPRVKDMKKDRDASVDRLLAGALNARGGAAADGACLDAETLAAWADGALDARERATAEAHAADCARCQALVAAMVRTLPLETAKSPWRFPALGWLVPLTAAATALAIWVAVPKPAPVQVSKTASPVDRLDRAPQSTPVDAATAATKPKTQKEAEPPRR